jgi:Plasma-membrane choline transporter
LFGKLFILLATEFICYFILINAEPYKTEIQSPFLPLFLILFIVYAVAQIFMFVYGLGIDSIFMCFLYDEKVSNDKGQPARFCPETLKQFLSDNVKPTEKKPEE